MAIIRTPRKTEPDTRSGILGSRLWSNVRPYVGYRTTELQARARRANAVVRAANQPPRTEPNQRLYADVGRVVPVVIDPERGCVVLHEPDLWQMPTTRPLDEVIVRLSWA